MIVFCNNMNELYKIGVKYLLDKYLLDKYPFTELY